MATFQGDYLQTIDAKRRLPIAFAFRDGLDPERDGTNFVLLMGPEKRPYLYPDRYCRHLMAAMKRSCSDPSQHRKVALYFARGRTLKPDAQGRVVLPEDFLTESGLPNECYVIGVDDHLEIWPKDEWKPVGPEDIEDLDVALFEASKLVQADQLGSDV